MVLVAPIESIAFLIMLVGGGMNAETAVLVGPRRMFLAELAFSKGFRVVVGRVGGNRRGIEPNERGVEDSTVHQGFHLCTHYLLQGIVWQFADEAVVRPVGRQGLRNVESAVIRD